MPKYVCDYDEVKKIGKNLCKTATEIKSSVKSYVSKIDNDLSEWDSAAKNSFSSVNQTQAAATTADAEYTSKLGEFIQVSADSIQQLDEQLASSIKI